jgi:hypothetical protein
MNKKLEFLKTFGIDEDVPLTYQESSSDNSEMPGYIKFSYSDLDGRERDRECANKFQAWMESENLIDWCRGYRDENPHDPLDRRFELGPGVIKRLVEIREKIGVSADELDDA